ncbi:hypothetical protein FGO68_gene426 [Halteria grandinella]|uniref:NADP-dependent oxidoreductase domain-containing protein n=1 Tax=Halteria grandinella TaxID=5974 RepID=A0A8J8NMX3_HALGN|nr:hypothetical protein FGO68_gene426 [Halteria grandinella]
MVYRYLGNSGLRVSIFSFGNMIQVVGQEDNQKFMTESVRAALDHGINFFDTAELYGLGEAEKCLGVSLKEVGVKREEIVVSTKLFWGPSGATQVSENVKYFQDKGINQVGLSRKHIIEGMNNSLARLQLDYADIVFAHRSDAFTPLEETCRAFSWLIDQGKAFYWGTSEWDADTIAEAIQLCEKLNLHKPIAEQCQYNMLVRPRFEKEYRSLFEKYRYGTTVWSPLAQGFLSGRYNDGIIPDDSRFNKWDPFWGKSVADQYLAGDKKNQLIRICKGLQMIAAEIGYTQAQLALAWALASKDVSTLIIGFSKIEQLEENMKALELYAKWDKTLEDRLEALLQNGPEPRVDFRQFAPTTQRRQIAVYGDHSSSQK